MNRRSYQLTAGAVGLAIAAAGLLMLRGKVQQPVSPGVVTLGPSGMQGPSGGPPPGGPGEMEKTHRYGFQLMRLVGNIGRMEESGANPLTSAQAKSMLAVIEPLRKQESLDETAAKDAIKAIQAVLTDKQRAAITAMPEEHQFHRGGPPPGGPPPSGAPSGPPPGMGPGPVRGFNPLNPPPGAPAGGQGPAGPDKLLDTLRQKAGAS